MPKHTFFAPDQPPGGAVPLPADEAAHATRVLRLTQGDEVFVVDGAGTRSRAVLETVTKRGVVVRIQDTERESPALGLRVTLAAALVKNAGRYETMLEKVAEIGAARVIPMTTRRTEQSRLRADRARKILVGAMKQSGSSWLTQLGEVTRFEKILDMREPDALGIICHEAADPGTRIADLVGPSHTDLFILVGPEGGFTDDEVAKAVEAGFHLASLGRARLRAETASIVALAACAQIR
ncbi:MAG: 16S rRNA (uracil(1498)-N(3))-methyltransferase [Rhodothermales bacterium]|nr:16S rRNA (uracil(1498)-N(3))-methyltransferase [Rhodothermales bacterium]